MDMPIATARAEILAAKNTSKCTACWWALKEAINVRSITKIEFDSIISAQTYELLPLLRISTTVAGGGRHQSIGASGGFRITRSGERKYDLTTRSTSLGILSEKKTLQGLHPSSGPNTCRFRRTPVYWAKSWRADPRANRLAKNHYTVQTPDSKQFVPPGRCLVLATPDYDALWVTSYPMAEYVRHAWRGAWVCSLFRNEAPERYLSSDLVRQAVAATRAHWPDVPPLGMITFIDTDKTRPKRDPGRCYTKAGFLPAYCPEHAPLDLILERCAACQSRSVGGLVALQMLPAEMPEPEPALGTQFELFAEAL
jgi:hypothetical protein